MSKKKTNSKRKPASCTKHKLPQLKYCLSCDEKVCESCVSDGHQASNHNVTTIEGALESRRKSMVETVRQAVEKRHRLNDCRQKSQEVIEHTQEEEVAALQSVEDHRENLRTAVDEACDKFRTEVSLARKGKVDAVNDQLAMISEQEKQIAKLEVTIKNSLKVGGNAILDKSKVEETKLKGIIRSTDAETTPPVFKLPVLFFANEKSIQLIKSTSAGVVVTERNCVELKPQRVNQKEPVIGETITILANGHPALAKAPGLDNFQPILVDGQGNAVALPLENVNGRLEIEFVPLAAAKYTIKLQLCTGRFSETELPIDVKARRNTVLEIGNVDYCEVTLHRPNDVCITSEGFYAIADRFNNRIVVCNKLGQLQNEIKTVKMNEAECRIYPHGVASTRNGGILIADPENQLVFLCDSACQLQKRIGGEVLKFPTSVAVDVDGSLHVIDSKHNALFTFNEEGEFLRRVPGLDDDILTMANPRYVCTSTTGEVIVADTANCRLLVLDTTGKPLNFIKIENNGRIGFPTGVTVDDQGTIYVSVFQEGSDRHQIILKYKMTGKCLGNVSTDESNARGMCMDRSFPFDVVVFADHSSNSIKGIMV